MSVNSLFHPKSSSAWRRDSGVRRVELPDLTETRWDVVVATERWCEPLDGGKVARTNIAHAVAQAAL
jgi:hypothetical protein